MPRPFAQPRQLACRRLFSPDIRTRPYSSSNCTAAHRCAEVLLDLQPMEIVGTGARLPQHSLHRAFIDATNIRSSR